MKEYQRAHAQRQKAATIWGLVLTVGIHAGAVVLCSFSGLKYIWPPPQEETFVIDFSEEVRPPKKDRGLRPRSENPDKTKPEELVQRSESPYTASKENLTPEATPDRAGDVEVPAPEPVIDRNALFPGMAKKDTSLTSPHSAEQSENLFKAGQADGNARNNVTEGKPNAQLAGRSVDGAIPRPSYKIQESGRVIVTIWVDNYGNVKKAVAGADGTTVTDKTLWEAARKAALSTHFTMSAEAPALQQGSITYNFNLK